MTESDCGTPLSMATFNKAAARQDWSVYK